MVVKPSLEPAGLEKAEAILTLSFDLLVVFTLMTGSPLDLSITTVRSIPLLPSGKNTPSTTYFYKRNTVDLTQITYIYKAMVKRKS